MKRVSNNKIKKILLLLATIVISVHLLYLLQNSYFTPFFKEIGVYPEKEQYTALFFEDSEKFAADAQDKARLDNFTFGVANHEGKEMSYHYSVDVFSKGKSFPVALGTLEVKSSETGYVNIDLKKINIPTGSLVYVTLPLQNRSIDFEIR
jgi:uncharacterized protein YxeA